MVEPTENPKPESGPRETPKEAVEMTQYKKRFEQAVADAQHMMIYASSNCPKDIKPDMIKKLINARHRVEEEKGLSAEEETDFWLAYQELWKLVEPATADSIKANLPNESTSTSKSRGTVNKYIVFTVFVLIFLLVFQIYWVIGNQLTSQLADLLQKEAELSLQINENKQELSTLEILYKQNEIALEGTKTGEKYNFYDSPEWERDTLENKTTQTRLEKDLETLKTQLERNSVILGIWSGPWDGPIIENTSAQIDTYDPQITDIKNQIDKIVTEKTADAKGENAAETLNSSLQDQISQLDERAADLWDEYTFLDVRGAETQENLIQYDQVNIDDEKNTLEKELTDLENKKTENQARIDEINEQLSNPPTDGSVNVDELNKQLNELTNQTRIDEINERLSVLQVDIDKISNINANLDYITYNKNAIQEQMLSLQSDVDKLESQKVLPGLIVSQRDQEIVNLNNAMKILELQKQAEINREKSRQSQLAGQFVLVILQSYLLPLLYGILGASTSVLRALSKQIETVTYSEEAGIQHPLRISLGALAGIMVGWFSFLIPSETTTFVGSISPLAIAFLVGYNIELFFSLMDRALFSITDRLQRPSPTEQEEPRPIPENHPTSPVKPTTPAMETPAPGEAVA